MTMRSRTPTLMTTATALLAAGAIFWATWLPAFADSRTFHDVQGETDAPSDVTKVKVRHGAADGRRLIVTSHVGNLAPGDRGTLHVDTRPRDRGPEYRMSVMANSDAITLRRVERFDSQGRTVDCPGLKAKANAYGADIVRFSIPRRCMDKPQRVRVNVKMRFLYASRVVLDWAPKRNEFFGWVHR